MFGDSITEQELLDAGKKAVDACRAYAAIADDAATKTQWEMMGIVLEIAMERFKEPEPRPFKEPEPRLLMLDEIKQHGPLDVFIEVQGSPNEKPVIAAATIFGYGTGGICTFRSVYEYKDYNKAPYGWRCWTRRPPIELSEKTAWEAHEWQ